MIQFAVKEKYFWRELMPPCSKPCQFLIFFVFLKRFAAKESQCKPITLPVAVVMTNHICNLMLIPQSFVHHSHNAVLAQKSISVIQAVMNLHLYILYRKVYIYIKKGFLPFQKLFSFCCLNVNESRFAGLVIKFVFFVQHLNMSCPEEGNK